MKAVMTIEHQRYSQLFFLLMGDKVPPIEHILMTMHTATLDQPAQEVVPLQTPTTGSRCSPYICLLATLLVVLLLQQNLFHNDYFHLS